MEKTNSSEAKGASRGSCEYQGVMETIRRITQPDTYKSAAPSVEAETWHRGNQNELCRVCKEGGDLLVCDMCPAAFHLMCCDPPLDEEDAPKYDAEWVCPKCVLLGKPKTSDKKNKILLDTATIKTLESSKRFMDKMGRRSTSYLHEISTAKSSDSKDSSTPHVKTSFDSIVVDAVLGDVQFYSFDTAMLVAAPLPESKRIRKQERRGRRADQMDNVVSASRKTCFRCDKNSRMGPMINCDYCSMAYHFDCLDPPLMQPTSRLWMCPLHVHSAMLDSQNTPLYSRRVEIFNHFQKKINPQQIKLDFIKKIQKNKANQRPATALNSNKTYTNVPQSIKYHYKHPVLDDALKHTTPDMGQLETVMAAHKYMMSTPRQNSPVPSEPAPPAAADAVASAGGGKKFDIGMMLEAANILESQEANKAVEASATSMQVDDAAAPADSGTAASLATSSVVVGTPDNGAPANTRTHSTDVSESSDFIDFVKTIQNADNKHATIPVPSSSLMGGGPVPMETIATPTMSAPLQTAVQSTSMVAAPTVAPVVTAPINIPVQLAVPSTSVILTSTAMSPAVTFPMQLAVPSTSSVVAPHPVSNLIPKSSDHTYSEQKCIEEMSVSELYDAISKLPKQKVDGLFEKMLASRSSPQQLSMMSPATSEGQVVPCAQGSVAAANVVGAVEDVEPIALLIDYDNPDNVFEIYETNITIGACMTCDIVINKPGCHKIDAQHAYIFYDQYSQHWEFMSYSDSWVDGFHYGVDIVTPFRRSIRKKKKSRNKSRASSSSSNSDSDSAEAKRKSKKKNQKKSSKKEKNDSSSDDDIDVIATWRKALKKAGKSAREFAIKRAPARYDRGGVSRGECACDVERVKLREEGKRMKREARRRFSRNHYAAHLNDDDDDDDFLSNLKSDQEDEDAQHCGWEGGAILMHGSLIQMGCFKLVFSIVDGDQRSNKVKRSYRRFTKSRQEIPTVFNDGQTTDTGSEDDEEDLDKRGAKTSDDSAAPVSTAANKARKASADKNKAAQQGGSKKVKKKKTKRELNEQKAASQQATSSSNNKKQGSKQQQPPQSKSSASEQPTSSSAGVKRKKKSPNDTAEGGCKPSKMVKLNNSSHQNTSGAANSSSSSKKKKPSTSAPATNQNKKSKPQQQQSPTASTSQQQQQGGDKPNKKQSQKKKKPCDSDTKASSSSASAAATTSAKSKQQRKDDESKEEKGKKATTTKKQPLSKKKTSSGAVKTAASVASNSGGGGKSLPVSKLAQTPVARRRSGGDDDDESEGGIGFSLTDYLGKGDHQCEYFNPTHHQQQQQQHGDDENIREAMNESARLAAQNIGLPARESDFSTDLSHLDDSSPDEDNSNLPRR